MEYRSESEFLSRKIPAGVCGIFLGSLGIHKFILGRNNAGLIMLLSTLLSCGIAAPVMHIIGVIEGIIYLLKSDADFFREYAVEQKSWL